MDSLKLHKKKRYAENIKSWLDYEWKRLKKGKISGQGAPFSEIPLLTPKSKSLLHIPITNSEQRNYLTSVITICHTFSSAIPSKWM